MGTFLLGLLAQLGSSFFGLIGGALGTLKNAVGEAAKEMLQYNQRAIAFGRQLGMSLKESQAYSEVLVSRAKDLGKAYGITAEEVLKIQENLSKATGKALMLNNAQAETAVQINKLVGSDVYDQFTSEMMNGMGAQLGAVQGAVSKAYATAAKSGLNAAQFSEKVAKNLSMANRLSFKDGVNGIIRMTALSEKLGINMASVESAAKNFMDLDKAIENAAHMQMLGGSAAVNFGNPLTAAYEANYDPEAFAKRMSDSLASYATFDANKGYASINGMNMDFVRQIAKAMGISEEDAVKNAKKQSEVKYKEGAFGATLGQYNQKQRDFILNKSYVENGKLMINDASGNKHDISSGKLSDNMLQEMMKFTNMDESELMRQQALSLTSIEEEVKGYKTSFKATIAEPIIKKAEEIQVLIKGWGDMAIDKIAVPLSGKLEKFLDMLTKENGFLASLNKFATSLTGGFFKTIISNLEWILGAVLAIKAFQLGKGAYNLGKTLLGKGGGGSTAAALSSGGNAIKTIKNGLGGTFKNLGSYGRYVKGNYQTLRSGGQGIISSAWKAIKGPKVLANGTITNGVTNRFMGNITSNRTASVAAKGVMKGAATAGRLLKSGGLGIIGAVGNITIDSAVKSGKIKSGGTAHYASKMAATAAEYAAFGSMLGPIGTGIGAAVGGIKGAYDTWKSLPENADKDFIDYAKSVGNSMIEGGKEAFNWAKDKIGPALSAINKEVQERGGYLSVAFNALTTPIRLFIGTIEGIAKLIAHPVDTIKEIWNKLTSWLSGDNVLGKLFNKAVDLIIGEKHAEGGIVGGNSYVGDKVLTRLNSGEMVLNTDQQAALFNFINKIPNILGNVQTVNTNAYSNVTSYRAVNNPIDNITNVSTAVNNLSNIISKLFTSDVVTTNKNLTNVSNLNSNAYSNVTSYRAVNNPLSNIINNITNGGLISTISNINSNTSSSLVNMMSRLLTNNNDNSNTSNVTSYRANYNSDTFAQRIYNSLLANNNSISKPNNVSNMMTSMVSNALANSKTDISSPNNVSNMMTSMVSSILTNQNDVRTKPVGDKEYIYVPKNSEISNVNGNKISVNDFNINLSGTIKLDGGNNSKNVNVNALLNDFSFMNALKEMIKTSINNDMHFGRYMTDLATLRNHVSPLSII